MCSLQALLSEGVTWTILNKDQLFLWEEQGDNLCCQQKLAIYLQEVYLWLLRWDLHKNQQ